MDITFIIESGGLSGGVRVILEYMNRLKRRGHSINVISLTSKPNWFNLDGGINWYRYPDYPTMAKGNVGSDCLFVATWWKTAQEAAKIAKEGK